MKVRITEQAIRLRISKPDMTTLLQQRSVSVRLRSIVWDIAFTLIANSANEIPQLSRHNSQWIINIPNHLFNDWTRSDEVGIYTTIDEIHLTIEKDFVCLHGPDDASEKFDRLHPVL